MNEVDRPTGNATTTALRRLRKDRPDLHAQVLDGLLTAHGAMVEAGYRRRTVSVRLDDMQAVARTLRRHLSDEQLLLLWKELES